MLLECTRCGAPLRVKKKATRTKCRYCGRVEEREGMRKVADEAPADFKPPKEWTPPAHTAAAKESKEPLKDKGENAFVMWGVAVVIVGVSVGIPLLWESSVWNTKPAALLHASPIGKRADVAKRLGGKAYPTAIEVPLRSDRYQALSIHYADADDPVPNSVSLELAHGQKTDKGARDTLSSHLNGGLDDHDGWDWGPARLSVSTSGLHASLENRSEPTLRERRTLAMWTLLMGAAFDATVAPTEEEMRRVLGGGYPLAGLSDVPATTPVDKVKALVLEHFPGALVDDDRHMRVQIPLDHPLFRSVSMEWFAMVGGTLDSASFTAKSKFVPARDDVARCLQRTLGPARESVVDPIKNKKNYMFSTGNTRLELGQGATLHAWGPHNVPASPLPDAWLKVVKALDDCRG